MKNKISRISPDRKMEIKELIKQIRQESYDQGYEDGKLVQSIDNVEEINDKWLAEREPKSPNQQRAELIQMAKDFVGVHKDKDGDVRHRLGWFTPEFYRKNNRVTCVLKCYDTNRVYGVGRANCMPGDVFNERIGEAISLAKAVENDIPVEFLEAVQPDELVVGHVTIWSNSLDETYTVNEIKGNKAYCNYSDLFWDLTTTKENLCNIIDDTNAQYGVTP